MRKSYQVLMALTLGVAASTSAQAHDSFSIGFNLGGPGYYAAPPATYYAPPPVAYYRPAPIVYYGAPPVTYIQQSRGYYYDRGYDNRGWGGRGWGDDRREHGGWGHGGGWGHHGGRD
jgi:hypothetical protein